MPKGPKSIFAARIAGILVVRSKNIYFILKLRNLLILNRTRLEKTNLILVLQIGAQRGAKIWAKVDISVTIDQINV